MSSYNLSPLVPSTLSQFLRAVQCFVLDYYLNYSVVADWMKLLLPLAVERNICIITNMGASKISQSLNKFQIFYYA